MLSGFKEIKKMNLHSTIWSFITLLLSFSIKRCPLLPADGLYLNNLGYLTVKPAPLFLIGSNLTVYCHITKCQQRVKLFLEHERKIVGPSEKFNCTMAIFHLFNVRMPRSRLLCKLQKHEPEIVGGLNLQGGLPPGKPENIICETSRSSEFISCLWERGQETYVPTAYDISVTRENGTQILFDQVQDAKHITIPRAMIDVNTKYQLTVTAHNHFGASPSDPFILCVKDMMIPETPRLMQPNFVNNSMAATLQWKTTESSEHLRSYVRLRRDNGSWETAEGTQLGEDLIQVDGLRPLTDYEFQMRTCNTTSGLTRTNTPSFTLTSTTSKRSFCSKWSPSVRGRSPGKGPSQQLHVWRTFGGRGKNGSQEVTVLWEPPSRDDYSGEVKEYKVFFGNDQNQEVTFPAALSWCSVQVPVDIQTLSISAVTSYGASPPADVPLRHSGDSGPVLNELAPAANGSAVLASWSWLGNERQSTLLHYFLEWTSVPVTELRWQKLTKDQNSTFIAGLTAGVRYNISLYAVTTRGVSAPSSSLVYSEEDKPASGPSLSVLVHEAKKIWIQWDELPVRQQRGFITNYTIYIQALDSGNTELRVTVPASEPRQKWLDCPEGALALQLTASTSAGEGQRGRRIFSQPATPAVGLVIMMVFIIVLFITIIANLLCWSCVRKRIKQKCISWGPAWLEQKLPKLGNSIAIKLLEQDGSELPLSSTYSDPPLSPISLISQEERDNIYPNVHVGTRPGGSLQSTAETPLLMSDSGTVLADSRLEHVSYKPQIAMFAPEEEEMMETEEERDVPTCEEEDGSSSVCGGLLGRFVSTMDFSDSPLGLTFNTISSPLYHKSPETTSFLSGGFLLGRSENHGEVDPPSVVLEHGETMTQDTADTCFQYTVETTLAGGYFPQLAAVNGVTLCDAQR